MKHSKHGCVSQQASVEDDIFYQISIVIDCYN